MQYVCFKFFQYVKTALHITMLYWGGGGVNSLNEYDSTIQLHMLTQNGEYGSVDAVLFSSSSLVFEFHLIYVNLSQKWTINKTTTIDLRGI